MHKRFARRLATIIFVVAVLTPAALYLPGGSENRVIETVLTVSGVLFAIIIGLFITDLWSRFEKIRSNVALEVSGFTTYFAFVNILSTNPSHKRWIEEQRTLISEYVTKYVQVEWHDYEKTDEQFNAIMASLKDLKNLKDDQERETYNNLLMTLSAISDARETLIIVGKDRLSTLSWTVSYFLSSVFIFSLFYINDNSVLSASLTVLLSSIIIFLVLVLRDLNDLADGEEAVSFEPYEKIFDALALPRVYRSKDVKSGRVKLSRKVKARLLR
jgi:Protein of unknown function (DUF4239)